MIGGGYGPYSYNPTQAKDGGMYTTSRFAAPPVAPLVQTNAVANTNTTTVPQAQYVWEKDPDIDDILHNPDPIIDARMDRSCSPFSSRGWENAGALAVIFVGLITLFAGFPIVTYYTRTVNRVAGFNLGGINSTGQIPDLPGLPSLIDADTPTDVYSRTGSDGKKYNLVFSDEFNTDGRTFYPGDDPYWEAVDINYWPTGDLEWYDPSAAITRDGKLVLTMTEENIHDLNFKSAMVTSWNKLCFTTGYIEVSISMPGSPRAAGLWPGAWTMGNLGRAGYGATTEGTWPYSYDSCDSGTFPNQTTASGEPAAALTGGNGGSAISFLPGQRLSACTCGGSDHPGPTTSTGRGVPEIDIIEHQIDTSIWQGEVSQSYQIAPFNYQYQFDNSSSVTTIYNDTITKFNSYKGGPYQQAVSAVTYIDETLYNGTGYGAYGYEWFSNPDKRDEGYITWYSNGVESWTITAGSIGADSTVEISERLIPEEPLYIILNLGMAFSFQAQDYKHLTFPSSMYIDYVRVYQRSGTENGLTCNPPKRPTADYIANHAEAYTNANWTTWDKAGYTFPRNSLYDGC